MIFKNDIINIHLRLEVNVIYGIVTYFDLYLLPKQTTKPNTPPVMLQPLTKGAIVHQTEPKNYETRNGKILSSQQTLETHTSLVSRKKQKTIAICRCSLDSNWTIKTKILCELSAAGEF